MLMSLLSIVLMVVTALYMLSKAHFAKTRRMAFIPLGCAAVEMLAAGMLTAGLFPVLTAVLILLRAVILVCCWFALRQDFPGACPPKAEGGRQKFIARPVQSGLRPLRVI